MEEFPRKIEHGMIINRPLGLGLFPEITISYVNPGGCVKGFNREGGK